MSEYIERGALVDELRKGTIITDDSYGMGIMTGLGHALKVAKAIPSADVVGVKHGRWEKHKTMHGFVYCSACQDVYLDAEWLADGKWHYCPNCGAKMDGGADSG